MLIMKFEDTRVHRSGSLVTPKLGISAGNCFTRDINPCDYVSPDDMSLFFWSFKIEKRNLKGVV